MTTDYLSRPLRTGRQSASPQNLFNPAISFGSLAGRGSRRAREQVNHYTLWNFVTTRIRQNKFASIFPFFGRTAASATSKRIGRQHIHHLFGHGLVQDLHEEVEPVTDHPAIELLKRVNDKDSFFSFASETMLFWRLTGRFYWWLIPGTSGFPAEIHVVPTQWVEREWEKSGRLRRYKVTSEDSGRVEFIPVEDMITHHDPSPLSKVGEASPIQAGSRWIDNAESIEDSRFWAFQNGANPDVMLTMDSEMFSAMPGGDTIDEIQERWMRRMSGTRNSHKPAVVPPGIGLEKISNTPKEMDYPGSAEQIRDNNLALQQTPPVIAGMSAEYNRATAEAANVVYCQFTMDPDFMAFASFLNEFFIPRFPDAENLLAWYLPCAPVDAEFNLRRDQQDFMTGAKSPDEIATEQGREPMGVPESESRYIPGSMMPLDAELMPEEPTAAEIAAEMGDDDAEAETDDELDQRIANELAATIASRRTLVGTNGDR